MVVKSNSKQIAVELLREQEFVSHTGSFWSVKVTLDNGVNVYQVYSYRQLIATVTYTPSSTTNGVIYFDRSVWVTNAWFSRTTSTHTNACKRAWNIKI